MTDLEKKIVEQYIRNNPRGLVEGLDAATNIATFKSELLAAATARRRGQAVDMLASLGLRADSIVEIEVAPKG